MWSLILEIRIMVQAWDEFRKGRRLVLSIRLCGHFGQVKQKVLFQLKES
jgi:hypothetical protein